ncbi:MAG: hypothetical protein R3B96_09100 [Pirellulaceae bacterium]
MPGGSRGGPDRIEIAPESPLRPSQRLLKVRLLLASAQVLEDRETG